MAIGMAGSAVQVLQAPFVASTDNHMSWTHRACRSWVLTGILNRHVCSARTDHPMLLALVSCTLIVNNVHFLQLGQKVATIEVSRRKHHIVKLGHVASVFMVRATSYRTRKVVTLRMHKVRIILCVQTTRVNLIVISRSRPLALNVRLLHYLILMAHKLLVRGICSCNNDLPP